MEQINITDELLEKVSAMSEAERNVFLDTLPNETSQQVSKLLAADKAVQQNNLLQPVIGRSNELGAKFWPAR